MLNLLLLLSHRNLKGNHRFTNLLREKMRTGLRRATSPWRWRYFYQKSVALQPTISAESTVCNLGLHQQRWLRQINLCSLLSLTKEKALWWSSWKALCQQCICLCWSWTVHSPSQAPFVLSEIKEYPIVMVSRVTTQITVTWGLGSDLFLASLLDDLRPSPVNLIVQHGKGRGECNMRNTILEMRPKGGILQRKRSWRCWRWELLRSLTADGLSWFLTQMV